MDERRAEREYEKLEGRVAVLEEALRETFDDCYDLNEFGHACEGCKRRRKLLT